MTARSLFTLFIATAAAAVPAFARPVTYTSTGANGRAASVSFDISGSSLIVTLTNTATIDAMVPTDVLTGVFFLVDGPAVTLTRAAAVLTPGSFVTKNGPVDPGNVVGGEWAYKGGLSVKGMNYGISSSGLGIFGPGDRFPGNDLSPPPNPDGLQYGLTTANDNPDTGNGGMDTPLIKNSVTFTLNGLPSGFSLSRIVKVNMQYGTALDEPTDEALVPTPGAAALLGLGGLMAARRRRR